MAKKKITEEKEIKEEAKEITEEKDEEKTGKKPEEKEPKLRATLVKPSPKEAENLVVKLAKEGVPPSKIGLVLRDSHSIPSVKSINEKKIGQILSENKIVAENDSNDLLKNVEKLKKHIEKNKQDKVAIRSLQIIEARLSRINDYYKCRSSHSASKK